ncbi:hypothetical protein [Paenibacillus pini]|uniref:PH domain-containing protein n=1 Tax=Paenibacillus pini JCM 16418 TaxID=1236976 RepID=W7YIZ4_9BACL|nr:hypothetical protein [Paenibacillus pini]GAF08442.1 hypothetical protein JCM16418_2516 [Paenibacillus pini JCM 16418]
MIRVFKGNTMNLVVSVLLMFVIFTRIAVQWTSANSSGQAFVNMIFIGLSVIASIRFYYVYMRYVMVSDEQIIIVNIIKTRRVWLSDITSLEVDPRGVTIINREGKPARIGIKDVRTRDRKVFLSFVNKLQQS